MALPIKTYLNEHEVSEILGVHVSSIRRWRFIREGPNYHKFGRCVRYSVSDVEDYISQASRR